MNMRNATCVGTETSKVSTRVTLLFIFYSVVERLHRKRKAPKQLLGINVPAKKCTEVENVLNSKISDIPVSDSKLEATEEEIDTAKSILSLGKPWLPCLK